MATFRYKPDKIKHLTTINTLDTVHRKHVQEFETRRKKINDLKNELSTIELQLIELEKSENYTVNYIKDRATLKTQAQKIHQELFDIENNVSELEYYSQTNDILLDYYNEAIPIEPIDNQNHVEYSSETKEPNENQNNCNNNTENHFKIIEEEFDQEVPTNGRQKLEQLNLMSQNRRKPKKITKRRVRKTDVTSSKSILDFFSDKPVKTEKSDNSSETEEIAEKNSSIEQVVSNKATLFDDYMILVDKSYISKGKQQNIRTCVKCNVEKTLIQSEGFFVCQNCGEVEHAIIESEIPSHKDTLNEKSRYPYKRLNHLIELDSTIHLKHFINGVLILIII